MKTPEEKDNPRVSGIQVIARAGKILRVLGVNPQGLSLAAIAQEVGLPRSTVQRITHALAEEMLVEQASPGGGIRLGPALGQLINQSQTDIITQARPYLQRLSEQLHESVCLCLLSDNRICVIDRLVAERELRVVFPIGVHAPAYKTSAGKVLLAAMPEADVINLLAGDIAAKGLELPKLLQQLQDIRKEQISFDSDEITEGVGASAVLLDTYHGLFSLCVVAPTVRLMSRIEATSTALLQCKEDIERAIGRQA